MFLVLVEELDPLVVGESALAGLVHDFRQVERGLAEAAWSHLLLCPARLFRWEMGSKLSWLLLLAITVCI